MTTTREQIGFSQVLSLEPRLVATPLGRAHQAFVAGTQLMKERRFFEALDCFDRALALTPKKLPQWTCIVRWNKALCYLSLGDYADGFREFEFRKYTFPHAHDQIPLPDWRGEPLHGKRILVYQDQGLGDAIQMLRYVPMLKRLGAKVTLLLDPVLVRLAKQLRVNINILISDQPFDFKCPLFGLMAPLAQNPHTVPGTPYLKAEPRVINDPRIKVGIAWSGQSKHGEDRARSIPFTVFRKRLGLDPERYALFPMQMDPHYPLSLRVEPFCDFAQLAEVMMAMDHVVSVSTAAICLAGALGHPSAHVMLPYNPDWRWYYGEQWYPTVAMYRQQAPGDWSQPFAELNARLARFKAAA